MARLSLPDLVQSQRSERYRALIIHGDAIKGKTRTARALAEKVPDATYIDLMRIFQERPELAAKVDRFGPEDLKSLLIAEPVHGQVVIVDHADPLVNAWSPSQRKAFARWVDDGLDAFAESPRVFVFFVQTDDDIVDYPMRHPTRLGRMRVFRLDKFYALS